MELLDKANVICEYYSEVDKDEEYYEFINKNDLGVPLSIAISFNLITGLTDEGKSLIEETYLKLLDKYAVPHNEEYGGIDDVMEWGIEDEG